ncbi:MAG: zinc-dependent alcohol dehydrogenase family protein [Planctomycetota bacterium]|nr:zinc-dependent alcohol dehydrogenase family protein [Planctomycetota bacterium]
MRTPAAVLYEMELPAPYEKSQPLKIEELELEGPGPGEVLVEIKGAGLCHSDLSVVSGARPRVMPMVLGHEASGIVRETGKGVSDVAAGDHVVFSYVPICGKCAFCKAGRASLCERGGAANIAGTLLSGARRFKNAKGKTLNHHLGVSAFSRFTVAAQESLVKLDPAFPLAEAALFGCAVMTGVGAIVNTAKVQPGESVAVFGLGGVGLSAVMGAKVAGAHPIVAVDLQPGKLALAQRLGATHALNATAQNLVEQLKSFTHGGAHYAFDAVGHEKVLMQAFEATRRGGTTVAIGLPHPKKRLEVSPVTMIGEERTLKGCYMGSCVPRRDIPRFIELKQSGKLPVDKLISEPLTLQQLNGALDVLARGETVRQVVVFE